MSILIGLIAGLIGGIVAGGLLAVRSDDNAACAATGFGLTFLFLFIEDGAIHARPTMTFFGILPLIILNVVTILIITAVIDFGDQHLSPAPFVFLILTFIFGAAWLAGVNSHGATVACPSVTSGVGQNGKDCLKVAYGIVHVDEHPSGTLPASTTSNLVIVTGDEAATKASLAMSSGLASTRNYSSYLDLGPATLQMIDGVMWYGFPLEFQGNINKNRLGAVDPGYILINAQDPNAAPVERYGNQFSMIVSLGGGQGSEPDRWARSHGYDQYLLDNPTLEIADSGLAGIAPGTPFWTVTLLSPQDGHTFQAPVGILLINGHTGAITRYSIPGHGQPNPAPSWVDRVYSPKSATQIANWYGFYAQAGFGGQGNANRYQVSGDPVMVYTGDGNPSWRMLLTSYGNEQSTYRIIEMDSATGAMQIYTPTLPMGIESSVAAAFCNGQGLGAGNIKSNHLIPEAMTLHVIDNEPTWMASFEPSTSADSSVTPQEGDTEDPCGAGSAQPENLVSSPSFSGVGFVDAYHVSVSNVVFGSNLNTALNYYGQQLASESQVQNVPGAGKTTTTITGKIASVATDISNGTETYLITLAGKNGQPDWTVAYSGTTSLDGYAIALARPGDAVIITVQKFVQTQTVQQITSFTDSTHPIGALAPVGGSTTSPSPGTSPSPSASASAYVTGTRTGHELAA